MNNQRNVQPIRNIAVIGAGAWGTALATVAARAGRAVTLWAFEPEVAEAINTRHENTLYLPGIALDPAITATADLAAAARGADALLLVVPAQHLRAIAAQLAALPAPGLAPGLPAVICAKGIERDTACLMTQVLDQTLPDVRQAVLSGPSFAADVARGLPTAVTLACADAATGTALVEAIGIPTFRPYLSDDLIGAEVGGAVKNVLAIACGIVVGRKLGASAAAALTTRGFAEMTRLGLALGARQETMAGLSGLGDLILTCSSPMSRNMSLGIALGEGRALQEVLGERRSVAEGAASAAPVLQLAARHGVEMPICEAVAGIVAGEISVDEAIAALLSRPFRREA